LRIRTLRIYLIYSSRLDAENAKTGAFSTGFSCPNNNWRKGTSMVRETREKRTERRFTAK
jgi:hypothetical protein